VDNDCQATPGRIFGEGPRSNSQSYRKGRVVMRYKSELEGLEAWADVPDVWTSGDYNIYIRAYGESAALDLSRPLCQMAGVLALILGGRVKAEVEGLALDGKMPDLSSMRAEAQGFLLSAVALPLEITQVVPFGPVEVSESGTKAKEK
jgi:hypothetical protein